MDLDFQKVWEQGKVPLFLGLFGLLLVSGGLLVSLLFSQSQEPEIEIVSAEEESGTIWVDLAGAVMKPGVYELPVDSRYKDLLARAGGLSAEADREWVGKNLNLAQKLVDGQKVYLPFASEAEGEVAGAEAVKSDKININQAAATELDSL